MGSLSMNFLLLFVLQINSRNRQKMFEFSLHKTQFSFTLAMNKKLIILFKFLDLAFHVADIYSDIATTALYYQVCQMTFFYLSLAIFFTSYLSTILGLKLTFYYKSTWTEAIGYPLKAMKILMKKIWITILCKYQHSVMGQT